MTPYTRRDWLIHWAKAAGSFAAIVFSGICFGLGFAALCALIWAALSGI